MIEASARAWLELSNRAAATQACRPAPVGKAACNGFVREARSLGFLSAISDESCDRFCEGGEWDRAAWKTLMLWVMLLDANAVYGVPNDTLRSSRPKMYLYEQTRVRV